MNFTDEDKTAVAKNIFTYVPSASLAEEKVLTKDEVLGGLSIVGIYMTVRLGASAGKNRWLLGMIGQLS